MRANRIAVGLVLLWAVAAVLVLVLSVAPTFAQFGAPPTGTANGNRWNDSAHDVYNGVKVNTFAVESGVLATEAFKATAANHTAVWVVTGGPAACTARLQGSIDAVNWFDIDGSDTTCTSTISTSVASKPFLWVRGNIKTFSGGSSPTITLQYAGY